MTTEEDEVIYTNRYNAWTPRLAKAAYNYQVSQKDPGNFAHGAKYTIQLLYDSIEDLNEAISRPVDLSNAHRIDHGHFAGSEEVFRHWDEDGAVPGNCSKCHSAAGLPLFMKEGVTIEQPLANGFKCATCHDNVETFSRYVSESVIFPSGLTVSLGEDSGDSIGLESNLCINCHQGRSSKSSMDSVTAGIPDDEIFDSFFQNIHYFAAGASLLGTEAQGGYEYDGRDYVGRYEHVQGFDTCLECHDPHTQDIKIEDCGECHEFADTIEGVRNIRVSETDFDGDGDVEEGILGEIETMRETLLSAMRDYAFSVGADPIGYHVNNYPYFFIDTNDDGRIDEEEANYDNRYSLWTPRLLRAAYNYQFATKDPGAYTHNPFYIIQILQGSLRDIGADISALTRP